MSLSRRVSANAAGQLAGRLYTSTLAFVVTALLLPRSLSGAAFGIFAFHLSLYQLLTNVIDFGAGTIVVREASRRREDAGQLLGQLVLLKAIVSSVGVALLVVVALVFEGLGTRFVVLALAALHLLCHAPGGAAAIFHVDMDFKWAVVANVAGQTAWLAGTVALVLAGVEEPAAYLAAYGAGPVVTGVLAYVWACRRVTIRFDGGRAALAALWREAWPAGVSMSLASVYFFIDAVMLRPMSGELAVGRYRAAYAIMTFALMVPVLFSQVVFPVYSRLWPAGRQALLPFHQRNLRLLFAAGLLVTATVPFVRREIMVLVYPPAYGEAADCLGLLFAAVVLVFCAYPHVLSLLASGNQRTMMAVSGSAALFNVLANLWAIPRYGILGAAATTVATEAWVLVTAALAARRLVGVAPDFAGLVRPTLTAAGVAVVLALSLDALPAEAAALRVSLAVVCGAVGLLAAGVFPVDLGGEDGAPDGEADA
jgi:O-antigen/teichoic acid export membrane protein